MTTFEFAGRAPAPVLGGAIAILIGGLRANGLKFLALALLLVALPDLGIELARRALALRSNDSWPNIATYVGGQFIALLPESGLYGAISYAFVQQSRGAPVTILDLLAAAPRYALRIYLARVAALGPLYGLPLGVALALSNAIKAGQIAPDALMTVTALVLSVLPGLALFTAFSLAPAIIVGEGRNVRAALARSWRLVGRARLRIAALMVIYLVIVAILAIVCAAAMGVARIRSPDIILLAIGELLCLPASILAAAGLASLWRQIAGPSSDVVAAMFD